MAAKTRRCACAAWEIIGIGGAAATTGCTRTTRKTFAQGHDARLKSLLIRAALGGYAVAEIGDDGEVIATMTATAAAERYGFGWQVARAVRREHERLAAKQFARQARATIETVPHVDPARIVRGKVGRWVYEGEAMPDGGFLYERKDGTKVAVEPGKWTQVD